MTEVKESKATEKIRELTAMGSGKHLLRAVNDFLQEYIDGQRYEAIEHSNLDETRGRVRGLEAFKGQLNTFFD